MSALLNLGYQRAAIEKALDRVLKDAPDAGFERALKDTLRGLMKA
jgi:Holliday junction resolvasome RuvABC DNA-binding subunit